MGGHVIAPILFDNALPPGALVKKDMPYGLAADIITPNLKTTWNTP